ncbi:Superfamily II DNA/RNA helicase, SNF2 family [Labilithrix luteola]|uniref:Superfamily II DNA/RNA helicase, SNF2 family n=1 Tax=Labilithrix luteola TaxID=1391654 RepID=A0A0K1Q4P4_9BACT|nr:DEAD/DEAH box helicase [Labilithrix luteola]AKV00791.1 Superfamily II DNA/RNA helicase, SNF2 family [Labilithrix luteola]
MSDAFVPVVRIFADEVVIHRTEGLESLYETEKVPLLELAFDYRGRIVMASEDSDLEDGEGSSFRNRKDEARVRRLLESFGAIPLDVLDEWATSVQADYVVRCDGNVHDFCAFSAYVVPQLRTMGWRVDIAKDYPFRVVQSEPRWYANVESSDPENPEAQRPDWFGLELGVDLDGRRVNLLPALLELIERANGKALAELAAATRKCLALPVGEGLFLPVPAERARAILRVLAELWEGQVSPKGKIEFPQVRAPALLALDEAFKVDGETLHVEGDGRARAWAELLTQPVATATPPVGLQAQLRPYQIEGLTWLQNLRERGCGGVLADDMGLGKTLQTISHLLKEKEGGRLDRPAMIIAPTSLVPNWDREIKKFAPQLKVYCFHGPDRAESYHLAAEADIIVTSYPVVCRDEELLGQRKYHMVILDEAQTIKNLRSRAHVACRKIDAEHRIALSGTPVENHLGELWALLDFVNPGLLGDEAHFNRFYRVPVEKGKNEERLMALREVVAPYILRRMKRDVAKELPPKTEVMRPIELRGSQRELYESIRVAAHAEVRKLIKKKGLAASTVPILGALTKLRQVCCDPRLVRISTAGQVRESAKYQMFFDLVEKQLSGGHRILVFSQFTSMLGLLANGLKERKIPFTELTGATMDRAAAVDKFESGQATVFLISLRAGGTGLTLTSADVVIHYDPWWNPAIQAQATDRAYRIGQKKPVISYHLFAAGSVEERILGLQQSKRHVADAILGNATAGSGLTENEIDVLFAPLGA